MSSTFFYDSSQIFIFQWFWPHFFARRIISLSNMIWWYSFPDFFPVSGFFQTFFRIFIKFSNFFTDYCRLLASHILFYDFLFRKFIRFLDFSPDGSGFFSEFSSNLQISSQKGWFTAHRFYEYFSFPEIFPVSGFCPGFLSNL